MSAVQNVDHDAELARAGARSTGWWGTARFFARRYPLGAAGAVIFECLTGRVVFEAPNVTALILAQVEEAAPDPRSLNPQVPHDLALIVLKALEKTREARFASAAEFSKALDEVDAGVERAG